MPISTAKEKVSDKDKENEEEKDHDEESPKKKKKKKVKPYSIVLKNMLFKKEGKYSFLDLKMGDCTVLRSAESNSFAKFEKRDSDTTSKEYGFRLTGFTLYNYYKYKDKYVI